MATRQRLAHEFGRRLRSLREARGLTSTQLADMIGVSVSWISHLEAGRSTPNVGLLARAAEVLSVEVVDLFAFPETTLRHRLIEVLGPAAFATLERLEKALAQNETEAAALKRDTK